MSRGDLAPPLTALAFTTTRGERAAAPRGDLTGEPSTPHNRPVTLPPTPASGDPRPQAVAAYRQALHLDRRFAPHARVALQTVSELGRGGMGVVHKVIDRRLERQAALKVLGEQGRDDPRTHRLFEREVRITARLNHPAIPPVYEAGTDAEGQPYLLMRLIEGRTLADAIRAHHEGGGAAPTRSDLLEVLLKVSDALAYAHSEGVIHRDLKPANVMVGRFGDVLVMDWGLALDPDVPDETEGATVGTPGYMSPEQAGGDAVDARTDVFALGAMLVEVLTDRPPIEGTTAINKLKATLEGQVVLPRQRRGDAPRELHSLAAAALAAEPARRMETAAAFAANLRAFLSDQPMPVHRYGVQERAARAVRRRPTLVAVALMGSVLLSGGGLLGVQLARSRAARAEAEVARAVAERERAEEREARLQADAQRRAAEQEREVADASRREAEAVRERVAEALDLLRRARLTAQLRKDRAGVREAVAAAVAIESAGFVRWAAAELYYAAGLLDDARAVLEEQVRVAPEERPPYPELFFIHRLEVEEAGEGLQTTEALNRIVQLAKDRGEDNEYTALVRSDKHWAAGETEVALRVLGVALRLNPGFAFAYVNRAARLYELERFREAREDLRRAVALEPTFSVAHSNLGYTCLQLEQYEEAQVSFDAALRQRPSYQLALIGRAQARLALADFRGAFADATAALEVREAYRARLAAARALLNLGRPRQALLHLEAGAGGGARDALFQLVLCRARLVLGDWRGALEAGREGERLAPSWDKLQLLLGTALSRQGRDEEALPYFERAIAAGGELASAYAERGTVRARLGDVAGGQEDLLRAVEGDPAQFEAWNNLARTYLLLERPADALAAAERALSLRPGYGAAFLSRAIARDRLEDPRGALADYTRAIELEHGGADPYRARAKLRQQLGDQEGATLDCRRFLELAPDDPRAAEVRARLAELEPR